MVTVTVIPDSLKRNWDEFTLPGCLLVSLLFQILLIVCAPSRKRTSSKLIIGLIWLAYLFADSVANFALGLISKTVSAHKAPNKNDDILVFWVPFLLLHFGGQDTIISFSIEDNALWLRQKLWFFCQLIVSLYLFLQSLPENKLWLPTLLTFFAGILKYADRLEAMYLASLDGLKHAMLRLDKSDPGRPSNVDQFTMEEYNSKTKASLVKRYIAVVQYAYHFFKTSKALIIGLPFSSHDRNLSRAFFQKTTSTEALELIGVELNFIYDALFTKAVVVHQKLGHILRAISFFAVFVALVLFHKYEKHGVNKLHVGITYTLLFSAIALDLVSAFMLIISDWTIVTLPPDPKLSCIAPIVRLYLAFKTSRWYTTNMKCTRRWSGRVSSFNFLEYSIDECNWMSTIIQCVIHGLIFYGPWFKRITDSLRYGSTKQFSLTLWESMFTELKRKSMLTDSYQTGQKVCSGRGDWTLQNSDCTHLVSYTIDYGYDQSILLWHIATDLCYVIDNGGVATDDLVFCRTYSKTLSDYMMHLLIREPTLMSSVAGIFGEIAFQDTLAEAKKFFGKSLLDLEISTKEQLYKKLSEMTAIPEVENVVVKGNKNESVLLGACALARELMKLGDMKWKVMFEVWVELLSYAASRSRASSHAELLAKGGELVTFIWLLMARLGIKEQLLQSSEGEQAGESID